MSVKVMSWVWEHSRSRPVDRLVLLAVADCASDDGANAYPSMAKLVQKTGLSERGIQRSVRRLVDLGELTVYPNAGPRGCNRYRVKMTTPDQQSPPTSSHPRPTVTPDPPSPRPTVTPTEMSLTPDQQSPGTVLEPSEVSSTKRPSSSEKSKALVLVDRPDVERVCQHLADRIEENGSKRPTVTKAWRDAARRLIDKDGRPVDKIMKAIDWSQDDEFWRSNVLSMPKLREQYDRLRLAAQRANSRASPKPSTTDQRVADALKLADKLERNGA